jgi:hypothetical protein
VRPDPLARCGGDHQDVDMPGLSYGMAEVALDTTFVT